MASSFYFTVVLCLTCGLWVGANAQEDESDGCCAACNKCPAGWTEYDKHCYMYNHAAKDWADAEDACLAIGGNLASFHNAGQYDFIKKLINTATGKNDQTWIGGHDTAKEGTWLWSDGSKFDYKRWRAGEPNNGQGQEHCMEMNYVGSPNDNLCSVKKPYVCGRRL